MYKIHLSVPFREGSKTLLPVLKKYLRSVLYYWSTTNPFWGSLLTRRRRVVWNKTHTHIIRSHNPLNLYRRWIPSVLQLLPAFRDIKWCKADTTIPEAHSKCQKASLRPKQTDRTNFVLPRLMIKVVKPAIKTMTLLLHNFFATSTTNKKIQILAALAISRITKIPHPSLTVL